jgi:hypothetical protein
MVVGVCENRGGIGEWHTGRKDIMRGLDVEGFFDFCVWRAEKVCEDESWQQQVNCPID